MQDRLKFRAWYMPLCEDVKPCYVYDVEQLYDGRTNKGFSYELGWASSFGTLLDSPEQFIVEQSTGSKDKNGKIIYEGDIIRVEDNNCLITWDNDNARYNVGGYGEIAYLNYNEIEVIGNIHENAELVENKDE